MTFPVHSSLLTTHRLGKREVPAGIGQTSGGSTALDPQQPAGLFGVGSVEKPAEWFGTLDAQMRAAILSLRGGS